MSAILNIIVALAVAHVTSAKPADSTYTTKYDTINIDSVLSNHRLTDIYLKCLLEQGRCSEEGKTLKAVLPEAIISDCAKCSPVQRVSVDKVMRYLIRERKSDFDALTAKYDPKGEFRQKYQKYLQTV